MKTRVHLLSYEWQACITKLPLAVAKQAPRDGTIYIHTSVKMRVGIYPN